MGWSLVLVSLDVDISSDLSGRARTVPFPGTGLADDPLPREQTTVLGKPRGPATPMRMSPEAVQAVVEPAGFVLERIVELPPFHYGAVFDAKADGDF